MTSQKIKMYVEHIKDHYETLEDLQADIKAVQNPQLNNYSFIWCKELVVSGCFLCYYYQVIEFYRENGYKFQDKWSEQSVWLKYVRDMQNTIYLLVNNYIQWN